MSFDFRKGGCQISRTGTGRWFWGSCWIWRRSLDERRRVDFGGGRQIWKWAWIFVRGCVAEDGLLIISIL